MYKLGEQGRDVQRQLLKQQHYTSTVRFRNQDPVSQAQNDVVLLLNTLKSQNNKHGVNELLSYVVHYFPKVQTEDNLNLLTDAFLLNNTIFPNNSTANLNESYLVIEAIKALFDSKIRISEPTLPLTRFFHGFTTALYASRVKPWKKVLVLTGILLSRPTYDEYSKVPGTEKYFHQTYASLINLNHELLVSIFKNVSLNGFEVNALSAISASCSLPFFSDFQKSHLPHESITLLTFDLIFQSPYGLSHGTTDELRLTQSPVLKHLNRLSFLIENSILNGVSFPVLDTVFNIILRFSSTLYTRSVDNSESLNLLKSILFSVIIIYQGFTSYSLTLYNGLTLQQYSTLSKKILKTLFFLNYILEKIGTGGFEAYNFVFTTTADGISQSSIRDAEQLGKELLSQTNVSQVPKNSFESSKVLFVLNYFENLVKSCSQNYFDSIIQPLVKSFITNAKPNQPVNLIKTQRSIIESSHSVIIATLSIPRNAPIVSTTAIPYLQSVLEQFPIFLSANQLRIAVEAIVKSISPPLPAYYSQKDNLREALHLLYLKVLNTKPGIPLPTEEKIPSTRAALIHSQISILRYIHAQFFESWLDNIWELIQDGNSVEFSFLEDALWKTISEDLDLQRGNIGIQWWYSRGHALDARL